MLRSLVGVREPQQHRSDPGEAAKGTLTSARIVDRTETLDELQLERLDWLKLNDGGSAAELLEGGQETLWRLRPRTFVRTNVEGAGQSLGERLKVFGYRSWQMSTPLF